MLKKTLVIGSVVLVIVLTTWSIALSQGRQKVLWDLGESWLDHIPLELSTGYRNSRDASHDQKVNEAKRLFRQQPLLPWPKILVTSPSEGYWAFTWLKDDFPIVLSEALYNACDTEALAGILAHEIAHKGGVRATHEQVDALAAFFVGSKAVSKGAFTLLEGNRRYRANHKYLWWILKYAPNRNTRDFIWKDESTDRSLEAMLRLLGDTRALDGVTDKILSVVRHDWGGDLQLAFAAYGDFDLASASARLLEKHPHRSISKEPKIIAALKIFRRKPPVPFPPIYEIGGVEGYYAYIVHSLTQRKHKATAILISKPLFEICNIEALAGVLAHEIAHPIVGIAGLADHTRIDPCAVSLAGAQCLRKGLETVFEGQRKYRERHLFEYRFAVAAGYQPWAKNLIEKDLLGRIDALMPYTDKR